MTKTAKVAEIINNIRRVFQVFNDYSKKAKRETGLTGPQLWAIKMIAENAPVKVSDLARLMFVQPATVVGILDRLEKKGLAARTRSQNDRRVVTIELTPDGKDLVNQAPEVVQGHLVKGLETLPVQRLLLIEDGMEQLVKILGAQEIPPRMILARDEAAPQMKKGQKS
ncbi:MarR family winged helix-turn-helix transcriptional regulator [Geobacter sp. AOG2]|uniref:MarR family winged helix-turn-helix transcriptional regulator n=1 Tax=Geobacter sp. AOG2 TaxID=1566347 RepID=UPI001CC6ABF4|nr:MarR family transcriptional regulator [Geobacter sp. AOG2]GFE62623.1 MarR family transcriptional regulator [Geobacter sp. AOG2]